MGSCPMFAFKLLKNPCENNWTENGLPD